MRIRHKLLALSVALITALGIGSVGPAASAATRYSLVAGSGSTWAGIALSQWTGYVAENGVPVTYVADGSKAGLTDYQQATVDFAASDLPYGDFAHQTGRPKFGYAYVPDTAGGIALAYHLTVGGQPITNLRLSAPTIMKIFTGQITNWDNPQITKDYGRQLPDLPIVPVLHSTADTSTFNFTAWLAFMFGPQWTAFCHRYDHRPARSPCGPSLYFPRFGHAVGENGPVAVANYIWSADGTIGYDEYAYTLPHTLPVVSVRNASGHYVGPAPANVTAALTNTLINWNPKSPEYGEGELHQVYLSAKPSAYPLSYFSYLVVPRRGEPVAARFSAAKGRTLSTFVDFLLCGGQKVAPPGFAALPRDLVADGLRQASLIPGHVATPSLARCLRQRG
jgi:ABC-type phosphate transport system substrate-binding protein